MNAAKIHLSEDELQLALNESIILTKNLIIEKVRQQWKLLGRAYQQIDCSFLPEHFLACTPKISKGENYWGLPYVVLDYPRFFSRDEIFAIRTIFWWGHDLSITLHLKGMYKKQFVAAILQNAGILEPGQWWVQHTGDEWQHHHGNESHTLLEDWRQMIPDINELNKYDFIKLVSYLPLSNWNQAAPTLLERFTALVKVLNQAPNR